MCRCALTGFHRDVIGLCQLSVLEQEPWKLNTVDGQNPA